ncbi:hypothetical protein AJ88_26860 [Mesorhizobium amorphae CCBAU 01583]|nr:hypothetical protein AJ88_26860 [Mesorhizobium amorphae CCBAU 01583]
MVRLFQNDAWRLGSAGCVKRNDGDDGLAGRMGIVLDEEERPALPLERERIGIEVVARVGQDRPTGAKPARIRDAWRIGKAVADAPMRMTETYAPDDLLAKPRQRRAQIG